MGYYHQEYRQKLRLWNLGFKRPLFPQVPFIFLVIIIYLYKLINKKNMETSTSKLMGIFTFDAVQLLNQIEKEHKEAKEKIIKIAKEFMADEDWAEFEKQVKENAV